MTIVLKFSEYNLKFVDEYMNIFYLTHFANVCLILNKHVCANVTGTCLCVYMHVCIDVFNHVSIRKRFYTLVLYRGYFLTSI